MENKVDTPSDPERCKGITRFGTQCMHKAEYGGDFCRYHGGSLQVKKKEDTRGFLLAKIDDQKRQAEVSSSLEPVKELRDSIALLHMLIEKRFNLINDELSLISACGPLNTMLQNMDKLVNSCHKIEQNLGELLTKQAIMALAKRMVDIIIDELQDVDGYEGIIDNITGRLVDAVKQAGVLQLGQN